MAKTKRIPKFIPELDPFWTSESAYKSPYLFSYFVCPALDLYSDFFKSKGMVTNNWRIIWHQKFLKPSGNM